MILYRRKKQRNTCGHNDKKHYAKGMCNGCYHKYGRIAKPTKCDHELLYAKGLCQQCYVIEYNKVKSVIAIRVLTVFCKIEKGVKD